MSTADKKIRDLGLSLPSAAKPVANYLSTMRVGNLIYISGQICAGPDGRLADVHKGKLGAEVSPETGTIAARLCALTFWLSSRPR